MITQQNKKLQVMPYKQIDIKQPIIPILFTIRLHKYSISPI